MNETSEHESIDPDLHNVHDLLREVALDEFPPEESNWKLPAERRSQVVAIINGRRDNHQTRSPRRSPWRLTRTAVALSAAACLALVVGASLLLQHELRSTRVALSENSAPSLDQRLSRSRRVESLPAGPSGSDHLTDEEMVMEGMAPRMLAESPNSELEKSERGRAQRNDVNAVLPRWQGVADTDQDAISVPSSGGSESGLAFGLGFRGGGGLAPNSPESPSKDDVAFYYKSQLSTLQNFRQPSSSTPAIEAKKRFSEIESLGEGMRGSEAAVGRSITQQNRWDRPPVAAGVELARPNGQATTLDDRLGDQSVLMMVKPNTITQESTGFLANDGFELSLGAQLRPAVLVDVPEIDAAKDAFSTFSLHVSDVSFQLARDALARGQWPEASKIRIEEFVGAFHYSDPMPREPERVACHVEQSIHPFLQQRNLMRIAVRTAAVGRANSTPLRLTLLLDNSGSMERNDRRRTIRRAFALLTQQLRAGDQVTLISFARQPRLLADKVTSADFPRLVQLIENLPSEGGTNIESALELAFEKAREQFSEQAQNRIVLLTDGAVNLGDADPDRLSRMITQIRETGVAFDAGGIIAEGLNDEVLEALTRRGDGRYYLLDSATDADDRFVRQLAGALRPSAKNVKVQVQFNPNRVGRYKLLGFEKHRLKQEDFRNDQVDAAEMSAAETGVALYQFEARPDGEGDIGSVSVRFRDLATGQMVENRWPITYQAEPPRIEQAPASMRLATAAAMLATELRGGTAAERVDLNLALKLASESPTNGRNTKRINDLKLMIGQALNLQSR